MSRLRGLERLARKEGSTGDIEAVSDRDGTGMPGTPNQHTSSHKAPRLIF